MPVRLYAFLCAAFFLLVTLSLSAQSKRANNWYFGNGSSIDFNTSPPSVARISPMVQLEGTASISDESGQLLFYTDGMRVWNRQHRLMPNGTGLRGDETSSQSALIIPKPGSSSLYYLFTAPGWGDSRRGGICYSVVDMHLNNGLGDLVAGQKNITLLAGPVTEKLAATLHSNGEDVWVVSSKFNTNEFHAWLVSRQGVAACAVVSRPGQVQSQFQGYLKFSPDGTRLAAAQATDNLELFSFDACTGAIAPFAVIPKWGSGHLGQSHFYGACFSPDGSKFYTSTGWIRVTGCSRVYQYDMNASDIAGSQTLIYDNTAPYITCLSIGGVGAMQLGPDGKIYMANWYYSYLHVIHNPNEAGTNAHFERS